jgi:hypothetical protein
VGGVYIACVGEKRNAYRLFIGNREGRRCVEDQVIDGRVLLKWVLKEWDGSVG